MPPLSCRFFHRRMAGPTLIGAILVPVLAVWALSGPAGAQVCGAGGCSAAADLAFDTEDLNFILKKIKIAERHAAGENLLDILPNASIMIGAAAIRGMPNHPLPVSRRPARFFLARRYR